MNADDFHARWAKRNAEKQHDISQETTDTGNSKNAWVIDKKRENDISSKEYIDTPAPTLEDAQAMTAQSDFTRIMKKDVDVTVKNTALKKLWADPRFNVQDGLDVYIDDYSKPDPMPPGMIAKLAHMSFLTLFDEKKEDEEKAAQSTKAERTPEQSLSTAESGPAPAGDGRGEGTTAAATDHVSPSKVDVDASAKAEPSPQASPMQMGEEVKTESVLRTEKNK